MQRSRGLFLLALGMVVTTASAGLAQGSTAFDRMTAHYERIRQALLHDSTDQVATAAARIGDVLEALEANLDETAAGIRPGSGDDLRALLPAIRAAAADLAGAENIAEAREAFGAMSKAMVRYRQLTPEPELAVAFCSMAQQVWLQPKGEIGNPYYGQSMARCGEIVSE